MKTRVTVLCFAAVMAATPRGAREKKISPLDAYIEESATPVANTQGSSAGSLWNASTSMANLAADVRARSLNDLVTIVVLDRASAVSKGTSRATRETEAKARIDALGGTLSATNRLRQLASLGSSTKLDGQGETTRENVLSTTLTARVTHVLPNGDLVVQGSKNVRTNSENQLVTIRGVVRALDLSQANTVASDRLGYLEVSVDGKGIVSDAVRRPNILYRILLGILPF